MAVTHPAIKLQVTRQRRVASPDLRLGLVLVQPDLGAYGRIESNRTVYLDRVKNRIEPTLYLPNLQTKRRIRNRYLLHIGDASLDTRVLPEEGCDCVGLGCRCPIERIATTAGWTRLPLPQPTAVALYLA